MQRLLFIFVDSLFLCIMFAGSSTICGSNSYSVCDNLLSILPIRGIYEMLQCV